VGDKMTNRWVEATGIPIPQL